MFDRKPCMFPKTKNRTEYDCKFSHRAKVLGAGEEFWHKMLQNVHY